MMNCITEKPSNEEEKKSSQGSDASFRQNQVMQHLKEKSKYNDDRLIGMVIQIPEEKLHMRDSLTYNIVTPNAKEEHGHTGDQADIDATEVSLLNDDFSVMSESDPLSPNRMLYDELHFPSNEMGLQQALKNLPKNKSFFAIPLNRTYPIETLSTFGADALKGTDKSIFDSIQLAASGDSWKRVLVQVERVQKVKGVFNDSESFSTSESTAKEEFKINAYTVEGAEIDQIQKLWMKHSFNNEIYSPEHGDGVILVNDKRDLHSMWGRGSTEILLDKSWNGIYVQGTSYIKTFLVVFTERSALYRMMNVVSSDLKCHNHPFSYLHSFIQSKPENLLLTLASIMSECEFYLCGKLCSNLIDMYLAHAHTLKINIPKVAEKILFHYDSSEDFEKSEFTMITDSLIDVITLNNGGWNCHKNTSLRDAMIAYLRDMEEENPVDVLRKFEYMNRLMRIQGCTLREDIEKLLFDFEHKKSQSIPIDEFYFQIIALKQYHDWRTIKPVVNIGFAKLREDHGPFQDYCLFQRVKGFMLLSLEIIDFDDYHLFDELVEDIVTAFENIAPESDNCRSVRRKSIRRKAKRFIDFIPYRSVENILYSRNLNSLLRFVNDFGELEHFKRIENWGAKACVNHLSILVKGLEIVSPDCQILKKLKTIYIENMNDVKSGKKRSHSEVHLQS